ncbi:hypothetical protein [Fusobacterium ulcerans]|uniref:hypothetical protein n=1 Tax=Fusobacterium ulcerans TaxID=861 RepID=UPI003FEFF525
MRYYRCKKCGRFIAEIRGDNDVDINGKVTIKNNKYLVECLKCGEIKEIDIYKR